MAGTARVHQDEGPDGSGFLVVIVIPRLDPGIAPNDRVRLDPRIQSGDDDEGGMTMKVG
jgi:hypothetical protein